MKKIWLLILSIILTGAVSEAQQHHRSAGAPDSVKAAFREKVAIADPAGVKWEKTATGNWTAHYLVNNDTTSSEFTPAGQWIATRTSYATGALPAGIAAIIKSKYANATIKDGWKIERSDVAAYYKVEIDDGGMPRALLLNDAGTITE
jgi:hypothetical protein